MSGQDSDRTGPEDRVDHAADTAESAIQGAQSTAEDRIADARDATTQKLRETEEQVKRTVRRTEAKVREQVAEVERTIQVVQRGLSEPTPARSVEEAARQASDLRRAIDRDLDALQAKLPPGEELAEKARTYGGAALGVLAVVGAAVLGVRQRGERKRVEREARAHAAAIAKYLPQAGGAPAPAGKRGKGGLVLLTVLAAAAGAVIVRQRGGNGDDAGEQDLWGPA